MGSSAIVESMSTENATKLTDVLGSLLEKAAAVQGNVDFAENGVFVAHGLAIDTQNDIAQNNFNKWQDNVNPMLHSASVEDEDAVLHVAA